jgi:hypothetical protein
MQAYKQSVTEALASLEMAITEAMALLPHDVCTQQFIASRHAPDAAGAWENVLWRYRFREDEDLAISEVLSDLVQLAKAAACLRSTLIERQPAHVPDLRLPRTRRCQ